jgi:hypothetical protein
MWRFVEPATNVSYRQPDKVFNSVVDLTLRDDGSVGFEQQYEDPEKPGVRAPDTPVSAEPGFVWSVGPPADPAKADCAFDVSTPNGERDYSDIKFDGPNRFLDIKWKLTYDRQP